MAAVKVGTRNKFKDQGSSEVHQWRSLLIFKVDIDIDPSARMRLVTAVELYDSGRLDWLVIRDEFSTDYASNSPTLVG